MAAKKLFTQIFIYFSKPLRLLYFTQIFIYFSKPLRLLYSLIIYEIVNFSFFTLYSLLLLSFFLYLKSVPIYVIVHVHCKYMHIYIVSHTTVYTTFDVENPINYCGEYIPQPLDSLTFTTNFVMSRAAVAIYYEE